MNDLNKYKTEFEKIRAYVNEFDLYNPGLPLDEYDHLTHVILSSIYKRESREKLKASILCTIEFYYGIDIDSFDDVKKVNFNSSLDKLFDRLER